MGRSEGSRLGRDDWARAAFEMFSASGLSAVAVERVAEALGATKGSFYWHFRNRGELVNAVLELWLAETEEIIDDIVGISDPRERLRLLFERVFALVPRDRAELDLLRRTDDPAVAAAIERVSARRVAFMTESLTAAGLAPGVAHDRAVQAYAMWLGLLQLQASLPALMPATAAERDRFVQSALGVLDGLLPARE
ncbi:MULTISPECIES: TetR/AcrR family transcriptional regulator [Microbacterium]|uniref:TetR/AcrR family transcriptional regulator n=1 Tax=Microbacterium TaxID=33882 RepID=UPI00217D5760|nr:MULTISPECIES: TetR/AcrR family transcriptional regulator [Microbacterium]UWF77289.1 TetR family transcriptional regulator [Microbacterium neungamense]WCM55446.1 TetR family transcriptional regulator [Microbacterium sp. EF45047]